MMEETVDEGPLRATEGPYELPEEWVWTTLGEVCEVNPRDGSVRDLPDDTLVSFVPMAAVDADSGTIANAEERPVITVRKGFTRFADGDVIIAKITPSMENGKAAIARGLKNGLGFGSTEFHVLRPRSAVLPEFVFHFVRQRSFRNEAAANFAGTAGQLRVPSRFLSEHVIPLAPLSEQRRIVAKIEELLTSLDAGVAGLKRIQAALKRYRAAVLKAACEGRLVPQDPNDKPAEKLLERILAERRAKWEADFKAKGKDPAKATYEEPKGPETEGLLELPRGWCWATLDQLTSDQPRAIQSGPFGSMLLHSEFQGSGILAIGIDNVLGGHFSLGKQHRISTEKFEQLKKFEARPLDVLITVMATVGRTCVVPRDLEPAIITKHVYRISANQRIIDPYYLEACLRGALYVRAQILDNVQGQTRPGINSEILRRLAIPIPPRLEQTRVLSEIDRKSSIVDELENPLAIDLIRAERLRQAILRRAFEGRLVGQEDK